MLQYGSACGGLLTYFGSLKRQVGLVSSIIIEIVINPRGQSSETARKHEFGDFFSLPLRNGWHLLKKNHLSAIQ